MPGSKHHQMDFNVAIGKRLMLIRMSANLTQGELGDRLGVKAQQVHKYETGENRLTAERIKDCAQIFGVPVNYFYGDDAAFNESDLDINIVNITREMVGFPETVRNDVLQLVRSVKKIIH